MTTPSEAHHASSAANEMSPAFHTLKSLDVVVSGNGLIMIAVVPLATQQRGQRLSLPLI